MTSLIARKRLLTIGPAIVALGGFGALAPASQIVGAQYQTNGSGTVASGSPDTAGEIPAANFNVIGLNYVNAGLNGTTSDLLDSTGTPTSINVETISDGAYDSPRGAGFTSGTGDANLYYAFALGNFGGVPDVTLNFSGLTAGDEYDLYTYVNASSNGVTLNGTVGSQSYYLLSSQPGAYVEGTATTAGAAAAGDYFEFTDLTGSTTQSFSLANSNAINGDTNYIGLDGFQLVDVGQAPAMPEPASLSLVFGGGAMLLARRRRTA